MTNLPSHTVDFIRHQISHTKTGTMPVQNGPAIPIVPTTGTTTPRSITTATHLDIARFELTGDNVSATSVTAYEHSVWHPAREVLAFPDIPKQPVRAKFFECPYCFTLCSVKLLAPKAWKWVLPSLLYYFNIACRSSSGITSKYVLQIPYLYGVGN